MKYRMRTILVDDEKWSIEQFLLDYKDVSGIELKGTFENPQMALEYAQKNKVDLALLDVEMMEMDGIELGKRLRHINPEMILIYISAYSQYIEKAIISIKADYYMLKPYSKKELEDVLLRAKKLSMKTENKLFIRTFGTFDVFFENKLVVFTNAKAKELLAICVDSQGGIVTMEKAIGILWEEREYDVKVKSLYRKAIIYLNSLFRELGQEKVFESGRGTCYINKYEISCDYYDYLEKKADPGKEFMGIYLEEYSWAEQTTAKLSFLQDKIERE